MPNQKLSIKIFIAGHNGMVGSSIFRHLKLKGYSNIILKNRKDLDLTNQNDVLNFFLENKIDLVYLAAAKVGGIYANNTYPAEYIYENIMIQTNVIHSAFKSGVKKLLFLGSSCIYPRNQNYPINEEDLLSGKLEPTNEPYAIAKIAGIKICESYNRQYDTDYRCVMPCNLYGPGDNYHELNSHVIPALIRRIHFSKLKKSTKIKIWGTGIPKREFLYVDDLAEACVFIMNLSKKKYLEKAISRNSHINIGGGQDISILELAKLICQVVGYSGEIEFDSSKPDGTLLKLLNSKRINDLGWYPKFTLEEGIIKAYQDFLKKKIYVE